MIAAAIALFGGLIAGWGLRQYAQYVLDKDYRDRARTGKRWKYFDSDAWKARSYRLGGWVVQLGGVVVAAGLHIAFTISVFAFVLLIWLARGWASGGIIESTHEPVLSEDGREQIVYALGGFHPIRGTLDDVKFGITIRGEAVRCAEVDDREQTTDVKVLATGPGGRARELDIHNRLDQWRYPRSEWFDGSSPEVLAEVALLEQPTKLGRKVLRSATKAS